MKEYKKIIDLYLRVHNKFYLLESQPRDFGTSDLLYSTEIHTIVAIGEKPGSNLTELSEHLGVAKSSVSKFVKKLLKKEYITKTKLADNQKEVIFNLTEKGQIAYKGHKEFSERVFGSVYNILKNGEDKDNLIIKEFLEILDRELNEII